METVNEGDQRASGWERIYKEDGDLGFGVLPKIVRASRKFKEKNYRDILDLGCGTGRHAIFLAELGFRVCATDLSPSGIRIAQRKAEALGLTHIDFLQHDMKTIPFAAETFDAVICIWTIYHGTIGQINDTIGEILRVLRPDGLLITDFLSTEDSTFGLGKEVETNTFVGQKPAEEDVPHHYTTRAELTHILSGFRQASIRLHSRAYEAEGTGYKSTRYIRKYFDVQAAK